MTNNDLMEIRAALMQLEKTLETERACIIRIRKAIERGLSIEHFEAGVKGIISQSDSLAGAVAPVVTT